MTLHIRERGAGLLDDCSSVLKRAERTSASKSPVTKAPVSDLGAPDPRRREPAVFGGLRVTWRGWELILALLTSRICRSCRWTESASRSHLRSQTIVSAIPRALGPVASVHAEKPNDRTPNVVAQTLTRGPTVRASRRVATATRSPPIPPLSDASTVVRQLRILRRVQHHDRVAFRSSRRSHDVIAFRRPTLRAPELRL